MYAIEHIVQSTSKACYTAIGAELRKWIITLVSASGYENLIDTRRQPYALYLADKHWLSKNCLHDLSWKP